MEVKVCVVDFLGRCVNRCKQEISEAYAFSELISAHAAQTINGSQYKNFHLL